MRRPIIVSGVAGSYITARLAPDRPMQHAPALGVVGLAMSIAGAVARWGRGPAFGARVVSPGCHRHGDAVRLGGRQTVALREAERSTGVQGIGLAARGESS